MTEQEWLGLQAGDLVHHTKSPYAQNMTVSEVYSLVVDHSQIVDETTFKIDKQVDSPDLKKEKMALQQKHKAETDRLKIRANWVKVLGDISQIIQFTESDGPGHTWDGNWLNWQISPGNVS